MKILLIICLASGLASSDKLDRSYLPPPGSKFSGGSPGDIETPLEFPKQSTGPQPGNGKPEIELGINRPPAPPTGAPDQKPGINFFQKSYPIPKTTTSYAITQATTFPPDDAGINQPGGFLNGSTAQSGFLGQNQGVYNQYRPGQSQATAATYGTTVRPQFPGLFNGPEYLPPISNKQSPVQVTNQDGYRYPSGLPQGPKYQDGQTISVNRPGYVSQQNQYIGNPNIPSTATPQYQNVRVPTGPDSQQSQNQFPGNQFPSTAVPQYQDGQRLITPASNQQNLFTGSQFPSSTVAPHYQGGQRLITPGSNQQSKFTGSQFPSSTAAPQYQDGQRLITPGSNQQNQFSGNQEFPSSTVTPQFQFGQRFPSPGLIQQAFGVRVPNQQNQVSGNQYQGNQNFPSSTAAPAPGAIEHSQFLENQNVPSTAAPNYQDGQRFTTPGQIQGALILGQPGFGSRVPIQSQNQFEGQNFPTSTTSPQFQDGARLTTPGYVQEGYGSQVATQQNQNQYPENQNYPSSQIPSQYQNGQQVTIPGSIGNQNFPSTAAPNYQGEQRLTTPGQYLGQHVPEQQRFGSRIPGQINQSQSTAVPQYQDSQRFLTSGTQERFHSPQPNQPNQYPGSHNFPISTTSPRYQDSQRILTPDSGQTFEPQLNQNSTVAPQYQGQRITTPGQLFNQTINPGSNAAPQYQQTLAPTPGINQQGVIPSRQDQFQRPVFSQQYPSSTVTPQGFIPGSQPQYGDKNILTPGGQIYGNKQQPTSQTGASFPSTTVGSLPARDFASTPGFGNIGGRPERPQAEGDRNAEILSYETVLTPEGYFYSYDTSNGIHADETGTVGNGTRAQGGFSYTGDDGKVYSVVYSADENGFQPHGDHLPTPPPIPEAIQRVIDQANKDKESGIDDDGSYNEEKYGYMTYEGPSTRKRPQNKTTSIVNGADIPYKAENRIGEQTKKTSKTKGRRPVSNSGNNEEFESDYESETDETDMNGDNRRNDDSLDNNKDKTRRITSKRPKPIKTLTVEDKLKVTKMQLKPTNSKTGTLQKNKALKINGSDRRPITSDDNEENTSDDVTEDSEDNGDMQESQGLDNDSDLVNYKDDPNNRTDFHGLNKYLPESKKTNRKNQSSKKRPAVRVKGMKQTIRVNEAEIPEDSGLDFIDESRTRIPSRIGQNVKGLFNVTGQTVRDGDDENDSYGDNRTHTDQEFGSDDEIKLVTNNRVRKPGTPQLKNTISGKRKRPNVNERRDMSDDKETKPSTYEDNGYEYTPPQRKFGLEPENKFPSRVNQQGAQTTLRPVMTKNMYGDATETDEYGAEMPGRGRPVTDQKQYPGYSQEGDSYNHNNPKVNKEDGFSTTRRPVSYGTYRPVGRPQNTIDNQKNPEQNEDYGLSTTRRPVSYGTSRPVGRPPNTIDNQKNPEENEDYAFSTTRRPVSYGTSRPVGRPQNKIDNQKNPEENEDYGLSTTRRPVSYGTSRPVGRPPNTIDNQKNPEENEDYAFSTTRRPVSYGTSRPFGRPQTIGESYDQNKPQVNEDERFSTTRRPISYGTSRPFGRPQITGTPQYQEQGVNGQVYNPTIQQRPGDKLFYKTNEQGTVGVFSSTTPLPPSELGYKYPRPDSQNRPTDGSYTPDGATYNTTTSNQLPSTTYRPNYSFGDKISSPVTVDGFGRPIQSSYSPAFDRTLRPTYPTNRPSDTDQFRPTEGRFGVTSTQGPIEYQSPSAPIGEDFSDPRQPQRFDPQTGYHYK